VPAPPNNVSFAVVQDIASPQFKTARERVTAHRSDPTCAGCHKITDPIGLALENFDGMGQFRERENGVAIDASGELDGTIFADAAGLGRALHDNPAVPSCLVERMVGYATGRAPEAGEADYLGWLKSGFAADGYRVPALLRRIALSAAFTRATPPADTEEAGS
jgi:hypothetical protein